MESPLAQARPILPEPPFPDDEGVEAAFLALVVECTLLALAGVGLGLEVEVVDDDDGLCLHRRALVEVARFLLAMAPCPIAETSRMW